MSPDFLLPHSAMPLIRFPAMPSAGAAMMLAVQFQLERTQWLEPAKLRALQLTQARELLTHAWRTVPYYRRSFDAAGFDPQRGELAESWATIPPLSRTDLQSAGNELHSTDPPKAHGPVETMKSSGSTGRPISVLRSKLEAFYWHAFNLRDHLWHQRDLSGKLVSIRAAGWDAPPQGLFSNNWGGAVAEIFPTGPAALLDAMRDIEHQRRWLVEQNPHYLMTHPGNVRELALSCERHGDKLPNLKQVRTYASVLLPDLREIVGRVWGVPVVDLYSCEEAGYIALQCPQHEHYHVMAENLLVEVLDDEGKPCEPGQTGRVVLTTLHNFACPLIRYEILDYAEVGAPCPCGRGLPVLTRIVGRQRNMMVLPNGSKAWPSFPSKIWAEVAPIEQLQLVQHEPDRLEARVVMPRKLSEDEANAITANLQKRMGWPLRIEFTYHDKIDRGPRGKYEDFICKVAQ